MKQLYTNARIILLTVVSLISFSCEPEPSVKAYFTLDENNPQVGEEIIVENLSSAEETVIGMCKWEWNGNISYDYELGPISFPETGEYELKLTVYADQAEAPASTYSYIIKVSDDNKAPEVSFMIPENIHNTVPTTFIDKTTDDDKIVSWYWRFGSDDFTSDLQNPEISFSSPGEYEVTLTVTDSHGKESSITKTILVTRIPGSPVASFTISEDPTQDKTVTFTDGSTVENGTIRQWEWEIDGKIYTEQNPKIKFIYYGPAEITLTVTDDKGRTDSMTKAFTLAKRPIGHTLSLANRVSYDTDGHVYWTSPAVSADGSLIYVSSTGYNLVCFDSSLNEKGRYNIGEQGAAASGDNPSPTPSIDADGNIIIPANYDGATEGTTDGGVFSIKPACAGKNWYTSTGYKSSYRFLAAPVFNNYIAISLRDHGGEMLENAGVLNRATGKIISAFYARTGSFGGIAVSTDRKIIYGNANTDAGGTKAGYQVALPDGSGDSMTWSAASAPNTYLLNSTGSFAVGMQPAISSDGKAYLCSTSQNREMICACYDLQSYNGQAIAPLWKTTVECGRSGQMGYGAVLDADGNAYYMSGEKIFRINTDGSLGWECRLVDSDEEACVGVAAIDSDGYLYVCVPARDELLKISSAKGQIIASTYIPHPKSCPTIAPDGTIYVTGNENGKPTIYKIVGTGDNKSTAPGTNWSQLGANPQKNGCAPTSNE